MSLLSNYVSLINFAVFFFRYQRLQFGELPTEAVQRQAEVGPARRHRAQQVPGHAGRRREGAGAIRKSRGQDVSVKTSHSFLFQ